MMIKNLNVKVIGLFGKYNYDLDFSKKINILIGENGDGKSTIINIIENVFNYDFLSLTKVKFKTIIIDFDGNIIKIEYNDLFAHLSTYFAEYSLIEDEIYRNINDYSRQLRYFNDLNEYEDFTFFKSKEFKPKRIEYFDDFNIERKKQESLKTDLVCRLVKEFGIDSFNEYVSLVINHEKELYFKIFDQLMLNNKGIYKSISDYFNRKIITTFTHNDFMEYIKNINKQLNIYRIKNKVRIIQNSRYLVSGDLFGLIKDLKEFSLFNNNFKNDLNQIYVKLLNMVQLYDIDSEVTQEQATSWRQRGSRKKDEDDRSNDLLINRTSVNLSIRSMYKDGDIKEFLKNFEGIAQLKQVSNYKDFEEALKFFDKVDEAVFKQELKMKFDLQTRRLINSYIWENLDRVNRNSSSYEDVTKLIKSLRNYSDDLDIKRSNDENVEKDLKYKIYYVNKLLDKLWANRLESVRNTEKILNDFLINKNVSILQTKRFMVKDKNSNLVIPLEFLSSGEKKIITIISTAILGEQSGILLIDEPELSLSIPWQEKLIDFMSNFKGKLIVATQSNHIVLDKHFEYIVPMVRKDTL